MDPSNDKERLNGAAKSSSARLPGPGYVYRVRQDPPHTFEPSSIEDAVAPPAVQTVTTLAVSGINLAPFAPQITNAVPPEIASQRCPGGGMPNPSYRFKKQSAQLLLSEGRLLIKASYTGQIEVVENVLGAVPVPCRLEPVNVDLALPPGRNYCGTVTRGI